MSCVAVSLAAAEYGPKPPGVKAHGSAAIPRQAVTAVIVEDALTKLVVSDSRAPFAIHPVGGRPQLDPLRGGSGLEILQQRGTVPDREPEPPAPLHSVTPARRLEYGDAAATCYFSCLTALDSAWHTTPQRPTRLPDRGLPQADEIGMVSSFRKYLIFL
jgi:hypothetical protein